VAGEQQQRQLLRAVWVCMGTATSKVVKVAGLVQQQQQQQRKQTTARAVVYTTHILLHTVAQYNTGS
jgi:hypothetical protein